MPVRCHLPTVHKKSNKVLHYINVPLSLLLQGHLNIITIITPVMKIYTSFFMLDSFIFRKFYLPDV